MQMNRVNTGSFTLGLLLIIFGILSLAGRFFHAADWDFLGPFVMIGIGVLFFTAMFAAGKRMAALAIPGSIMTGMGAVILFQYLSHKWEAMSYLWTLFIVFVGAGIYIMGLYSGNARQKGSGVCVMKVGVILFLIFGALFEIVLSSFNSYTFPVLLILLGAYLIASRAGWFNRRKLETPSDHSISPAND